jgi:hypothetical protein
LYAEANAGAAVLAAAARRDVGAVVVRGSPVAAGDALSRVRAPVLVLQEEPGAVEQDARQTRAWFARSLSASGARVDRM